MYSWGPDTTDWRGTRNYDYGSARAAYANIAAQAGERKYIFKREPNMALVNPKAKVISTQSEFPLIVGVDVTGSMDVWPAEIFDRLPLMYQTLNKYKPGLEISFCAFGDSKTDFFSLQVNDFGKDLALEEKLNALGCEGQGGGQGMESPQNLGYFLLNHCNTPNARRPYLLLYSDESFHPEVDPNQIKHLVGDILKKPIPSKELWGNLKERFNVYMLHKRYTGHALTDNYIVNSWKEVLGNDRVIILPSMERAVDVGIAMIAKEWKKMEDFDRNIDARHTDPEVKRSIHKSIGYDSKNSIRNIKTGSKKNEQLI